MKPAPAGYQNALAGKIFEFSLLHAVLRLMAVGDIQTFRACASAPAAQFEFFVGQGSGVKAESVFQQHAGQRRVGVQQAVFQLGGGNGCRMHAGQCGGQVAFGKRAPAHA